MLLALLATGAAVALLKKAPTGTENIRVITGGPPFSSDPLEFDTILNALVFRPTHAVLVTRSNIGSFAGELAARWDSSMDHRVWRFEVRRGVRFETGEEILPKHFVRAWERLARELRRRRSQDGFLDGLEGYDIADDAGRISGLEFDSDSITMRFRRPMPRLLEFLSFGMYAVVHPGCYDSNSGAWTCNRRDVASGPYRVARWDDGSVALRLRSGFPSGLFHPNPIPGFDIFWGSHSLDSAELVVGGSLDGLPTPQFEFHGGPVSGIIYARCTSWTHPKSVCHGKAFRKRLRAAFHLELEHLGVSVTRSFFPLSIPGVVEFNDPHDRTPLSSHSGRSLALRNPYRFLSVYSDALRAAAKTLGVDVHDNPISRQEMNLELAPNLRHYKNDIALETTSITIDDPAASVHFMFRSTEGIRLPDATGRGALALARSPLDYQALNRIIWDDAVIWPIGHYSKGLWSRDGLDVSLANMTSFPPPLHWIGWGLGGP